MLPQDWIEVSRVLYKQNQQSLFQRPRAISMPPLIEALPGLARVWPMPLHARSTTPL